MWSVWSEHIEVYMGRNLAVVRHRGGPTTIIEHPSTWPLQRVLARVASVWQSPSDGIFSIDGSAKQKFGRRNLQLHITLGSSRCRSEIFVVPQGVQRCEELQSLAFAAAVHSGDSEAIICAFDPFRPGPMSSIGARFLDDLNSWAVDQGASIASLQPLWATATQCAASSRKDITALVLSEPDGITMLVSPDNSPARSTPASISLIVPDMLEEQVLGQTMLMNKRVQQQVWRWKVANGLQDENSLTLVFDPTVTSKGQGMPKRWNPHWSCA